MKILILDGSCSIDKNLKIARKLTEEILEEKKYNVISFALKDIDIEITHCCGFFKCWLKTPGICAIKDVGLDISRLAASSDWVIFFTPVTFGGYSQHLKKALDRMLPILTPFFTKINGEVHHKYRYEKKAGLIAFGSLPHHDVEKESIFSDLVQRHSINCYKHAISKVFIDKDDEKFIRENVMETLKGAHILE